MPDSPAHPLKMMPMERDYSGLFTSEISALLGLMHILPKMVGQQPVLADLYKGFYQELARRQPREERGGGEDRHV